MCGVTSQCEQTALGSDGSDGWSVTGTQEMSQSGQHHPISHLGPGSALGAHHSFTMGTAPNRASLECYVHSRPTC